MFATLAGRRRPVPRKGACGPGSGQETGEPAGHPAGRGGRFRGRADEDDGDRSRLHQSAGQGREHVLLPARNVEASFKSGVSVEFGNIVRTTSHGTSPGSITIDSANPRFRIIGEAAYPVAGQTLEKIGRTTGWTYGQVTNTCVDTNVAGSNITLLCQDYVSAGIGAGDSGSPVFAWNEWQQ